MPPKGKKKAAAAAAAAEEEKKPSGFTRGRFGKRPIFQYNGKRCQGLHRFLKTHFFDKEAVGWGVRVHPAPRTAPVIGDEGKKPGMSAMQQAAARGIATDKQVTHWIESGGELTSDANQFTRTLVNWYVGARLRGVSAQGIVGAAEARVATAYDALLQSRSHRGGLYLVENKTDTTGPASFEEAGGLVMKKPLQDVPCSRANMARLQLACTKWMFEQTHPDTVLAGAYVVRAGRKRDDCTVYRIDDEPWIAKGLAAFQVLITKRAAKHTKAGSKRKAAEQEEEEDEEPEPKPARKKSKSKR